MNSNQNNQQGLIQILIYWMYKLLFTKFAFLSKSQAGFAILPVIIIIFLIGGIIATTQLAKIQQIFKSRANTVTTPFYAQVMCDSTGKAIFSWNELPEVAEYIVNVPRTANTPQYGVEAGRRTTATLQLEPGTEYPDWEIKVGLKTGGYQTFDQKEFKCDGTTSGEVPSKLYTYPASAAVTCTSNGQATFRWSTYPGATNYTVNVYGGTKTTLNAGTSTSVTAALEGGRSYADWELIVSLPDDTKVLDQLEFTCDGTTRGETPTETALPAAPSATANPTTEPTSAPICNGHCAAVGETQGEFVCVDDQGDRQWRLPQCTGNSNCDCTDVTL